MDLFKNADLQFEKVAAEVELPEDPNAWSAEVLDELYKQVPYIADFQPHVVMEKVDGERGYGFGHVEISNQTQQNASTDPAVQSASSVRSVRIPVIINQGKLSPFDLAVNDKSKVIPLTEARLRQAIFRPQPFDVTGETPEGTSMMAALYPPYRQNAAGGGGGVTLGAQGMGKMGSVFEEYLAKELEKRDAGFRTPGKTKTAGGLLNRIMGAGTEAAGETVEQAAKGATKGVLSGAGEVAKDVASKNKGALAAAGATAVGVPAAAVGAQHALAKSRQNDLIEAMKGQQKNASVMEAILPTIGQVDLNNFWGTLENSETLRNAFTKNAHASARPLKLLAEVEPMTVEKLASALPAYMKPTVTQIRNTGGAYLVKTANASMWHPTSMTLTRGEAVDRFGPGTVLEVDKCGSVTLAVGAEAKDLEKRAEAPAEAISESGIYKVVDSEGKELIGFVIPNLYDSDGGRVPLALFTNGSQATIQAEIFGEEAGEGVNLPTGPIQGMGFFFNVDDDGRAEATLPMAIKGSHAAPGEPSNFVGELFDGRPIEVSVQPNIQVITPMEEGKLLIPAHWRWSSMEQSAEVSLAGGDPAPGELEGEAPEEEEAPAPEEKVSHVFVRSSANTFSLSGPALEKVAEDQRSFVDFEDALFLLAGCGTDMGYGATKLAHAMTNQAPERVVTGRSIVTAEEQMKISHANAVSKWESYPNLKQNLVKEAATIPDPTAVDTVLSLGFINPENLTTFVSYLPTIDDAQLKMCELLLSARLGMKSIPASALERAIRSTEETIEGLKIIAFQS
jgi:hypothetical protein